MKKRMSFVLAIIISICTFGCGKFVPYTSEAMKRFDELEKQEVKIDSVSLNLADFQHNAEIYDQKEKIYEDVRQGKYKDVSAQELLHMEQSMKNLRPVRQIRVDDVWYESMEDGVYGFDHKDKEFEYIFWGRKYALGIFELDRCYAKVLVTNNMVQVDAESDRIIKYRIDNLSDDSYVIYYTLKGDYVLLEIKAESTESNM